MSPTSYQLLYPATFVFRRAKSNISHTAGKVNPENGISENNMQGRKLNSAEYLSIAKKAGLCNNIRSISLYSCARGILHFLFPATLKKEGYPSAWLAVQQCGDLL